MDSRDEPTQADLEEAKEDANKPIYVPQDWFDKAGMPYPAQPVDGEVELHPFGSGRKFAAERLGFFVTNSTLESKAGIVYFCIADSATVRASRNPRQEDRLKDKVEEWADAIGATVSRDNPAHKLLAEINSELWLRETASDSKPDVRGGGGTTNPNG